MNQNLQNGVMAAKKRVDTLIEHMVRNGVQRSRTDGVWEVSETSSVRFFDEGRDIAMEHIERYTVVLYCSMFGGSAFYEWVLPLPDIDILLQKINTAIDLWEEQVYARWPKQKEAFSA